jgi:hypothetical protein
MSACSSETGIFQDGQKQIQVMPGNQDKTRRSRGGRDSKSSPSPLRLSFLSPSGNFRVSFAARCNAKNG